MNVISEQELIARLDFRRPLTPKRPELPSAWPIPFEYGENQEGTRISVTKAREIIAELRAEVVEYEKGELLRAFEAEKARVDAITKQYSEMSDRWMNAMQENAALKRRLRRAKK